MKLGFIFPRFSRDDHLLGRFRVHVRAFGDITESGAKTELATLEGDLTGWQEVLQLAIKLAGNCYEAYRKARPPVRRRLNDVVFRAVYVRDGNIDHPEFTEIFEPLFARPSSNKRLKVELKGHYSNTLAEKLKSFAP